MIMFRASGGLGNQMFQYGTARHLASRLGTDLLVDTEWFRLPKAQHPWLRFALPRLRVNLREAPKWKASWARSTASRIPAWLPVPFRWTFCPERGAFFDREVLEHSDRTYLRGLWQSGRYFEEIRDLLIPELQPAEPLPSEDLELAAQARECNSVAAHVRRNDYVGNDFYGLCPPAYYQRSLALIAEKKADPRVFVFSDDPEWASENLRFDVPTQYVSRRGSPPHRDMWLMSQCRHNIIANSTYSWWGAWLGDNRDRIVVAPKQWWAYEPPPRDIMPQGWLQGE